MYNSSNVDAWLAIVHCDTANRLQLGNCTESTESSLKITRCVIEQAFLVCLYTCARIKSVKHLLFMTQNLDPYGMTSSNQPYRLFHIGGLIIF